MFKNVTEFHMGGSRNGVLVYDGDLLTLELPQVGAITPNVTLTMCDMSQLESEAPNPLLFVEGKTDACFFELYRNDNGHRCTVVLAKSSVLEGETRNYLVMHVEDMEEGGFCTHHMMLDSMMSAKVNTQTGEKVG